MSTTNGHVKGQVDPLYFNHPLISVAVDGNGNFTVLYGSTPVGVMLENYSANGTQIWVNEGLTFAETACPDPDSDTDVYTPSKRFTVNYANPPGQGSQWSYTGYTIDPNKYGSADERYVNGWDSGPLVVRLSGQKFLAFRDGTAIEFFRFSPSTDGETAIPCAIVISTGQISGPLGAAEPAVWRRLDLV